MCGGLSLNASILQHQLQAHYTKLMFSQQLKQMLTHTQLIASTLQKVNICK